MVLLLLCRFIVSTHRNTLTCEFGTYKWGINAGHKKDKITVLEKIQHTDEFFDVMMDCAEQDSVLVF